jgi:DNA-binding PadR family transcriptional regulator
MSTPTLTTTSYAILGLLAVQPWSSYELTRQMDRSLGRFWPRATSKLYEEPKKLVEHGLAAAATEQHGRRRRTVYSITADGRRALAAWLAEPGAGPVLESEQVLKVFFAEHGSRESTLATLHAAQEWAKARAAESLAVGEHYVAGEGQFPQRLPELVLTSRFLTDFYALVHDWAQWAEEIARQWPDDPRRAQHDAAALEETVRRARRVVEAPTEP